MVGVHGDRNSRTSYRNIHTASHSPTPSTPSTPVSPPSHPHCGTVSNSTGIWWTMGYHDHSQPLHTTPPNLLPSQHITLLVFSGLLVVLPVLLLPLLLNYLCWFCLHVSYIAPHYIMVWPQLHHTFILYCQCVNFNLWTARRSAWVQ